MVPEIRVRQLNQAPVRPDRPHVLYWMTANRRTGWNFALEHAVEQSRALGRPLVVLEALRAGHRWASRRFHAFVLDGMADNRRAFQAAGVTYHAYVEPAPGDASGLLETLASTAALVVTDDFPCFFLPRMAAAAAARLDVRVDSVDANGLLPLSATDRLAPTAYVFRRVLQQLLPRHLPDRPAASPLAGAHPPAAAIADTVTRRWPDVWSWLARGGSLDALPINQGVGPTGVPGGSAAAARALTTFLDDRLADYADRRSQPQEEVASGFSPYLHWGHLSVHQVFDALSTREGWLGHLPARATGAREGWWGMSRPAEAFLDELVTWREVGFNMCHLRPDDYDRYESLPDWARRSLDGHAEDPRDPCYSLEELEAAATYDPLWNAAQRQLVREGRIHNYLRMLWGKKILQWTESPRQALDVMIELNNKYALDGRNPNSYSGIFWTLGRYDRPWAPERPVFGVIRYMSSENTARKVRVREYLKRYDAQPGLGLD
ncbi:MAG: deoxyribodipyrimidine photo-lyase [Vicinamibacterales bacterium]